MPQAPRKNLTTAHYHFFLTDEFSQWYPSRFTSKEGLEFICCEQYMMYGKAMLFGDLETAQKIMDVPSQKECVTYEDYKAQNQAFKDLGRAVKGFNQEVWDAHAWRIVYQGNYYKFTQNPALYNALMAVDGRELVEAAHYDKVWGVGLRADDPLILDPANWKGKNWLGSVLTNLRCDLACDAGDGVYPERTEDNWPVVKFYDEDGQRTLYITAAKLAQQWIADYNNRGVKIEQPADPVAWLHQQIRKIVKFDKGRPYDMHDDPDIDPTTLGATIEGQGYLENRLYAFIDLNEEFMTQYAARGLKGAFQDIEISFIKPTGWMDGKIHTVSMHLRVPADVMPKYEELKELISELPESQRGQLWQEAANVLIGEGAVMHRENGPACTVSLTDIFNVKPAKVIEEQYWVNGVKKPSRKQNP